MCLCGFPERWDLASCFCVFSLEKTKPASTVLVLMSGKNTLSLWFDYVVSNCIHWVICEQLFHCEDNLCMKLELEFQRTLCLDALPPPEKKFDSLLGISGIYKTLYNKPAILWTCLCKRAIGWRNIALYWPLTRQRRVVADFAEYTRQHSYHE